MNPLPPLNTLRAFDAAARHGSFSRAADALSVTHGAVSKQIASLEAFLGVAVFERTAHGLEPTEAGAVLAPIVAEALDAMAEGVRRVRRSTTPSTLTISVLPSFAAHWLIHRMPRFLDRHPEIDVRFFTTRRVVDLTKEDVDLAIRYGMGDWPGVHAECFMRETLTPVYSPALAALHPELEPADLLRFVILSHHTDAANWKLWRTKVGLPDLDLPPVAVYDDTALAMQAVLGGQGVVLGRSPLIVDELAAGRLVRLSDVSIPSAESDYLVCLERHRARPAIKAFRDWLVEEAGLG
ncbi:transcriptional regulator GcvA [Thalassobaculum sp.]|uniref:transcriptional regulator GcvA n=1 Tax=Thalassobaculum sp. TaxID=2022740 RepID=UPI0032EB6880